LRAWVQTPDAAGCFKATQAATGLLGCSIQKGDPSSVLLIGSDEAIRKGKIVLEIHFFHQGHIQNFHERYEKSSERLQELEEICNSGITEEFVVEDDSLVGFIIGSGGENIKKVRQEHDVEVSVLDGSPTKVVIRGETREQVAAARAQCEFVSKIIPVEQDMIGWMFGKAGRNIQEIKAKTGVVKITLHKETNLVVVGVRDAVETATTLLECHAQYFAVYQEMDRETSAIDKSFEELEITEKGRRKGKGGKGRSDKGQERNPEAESKPKGSKGKGRGAGSKTEDSKGGESKKGAWDSQGGGKARKGKGGKGK